MQVRILVAEPLYIFRSGLRTVAAREEGVELLEASDLDGLLRRARESPPGAAIVDLGLRPDGGLVAVERLLESSPATRAVVWSFEPTAETVLAALRAGASGYLRKEVDPPALQRALRTLAAGEMPLPRAFAGAVVDELHRLQSRERARDRAAVLSLREREVLDLVARGASNRDVASALFLSELTVKRHLQNIRRKLGVPSRDAAAAFYRDALAG
jgi:DNA-binding NarL/FixJ family response regulator